MKFLVKNYTTEGTVHQKPVNWIKTFREEVGCGLKEAKDVCDHLRHHHSDTDYHTSKTIEIDSNSSETLKFLETSLRIKVGQASMIRLIDTTTEQTSAILKSTANRLIRLGAYKEARKVLKILM